MLIVMRRQVCLKYVTNYFGFLKQMQGVPNELTRVLYILFKR